LRRTSILSKKNNNPAGSDDIELIPVLPVRAHCGIRASLGYFRFIGIAVLKHKSDEPIKDLQHAGA
jgi:hypothetical protein